MRRLLLFLIPALALSQVSQPDSYTQTVINSNPNLHFLWSPNCATNSSQTTPGYAEQNCLNIQETVTNGLALYGSLTQAKKTFLVDSVNLIAIGSGQRIARSTSVNCATTESDCAGDSTNITFAGVPITGDEATGGFSVVNYLHQPASLNVATIASVPTPNSYSTTLTQSVSKAIGAQTVTVASTSGCVATSSPGDSNGWVVIGQEAATGSPQEFPVQITNCGSGQITAIFVGNTSSGATITAAVVVNVNSSSGMGQGGVFIDHTQASYTTGTVGSISGGGMVGSGTSWTSSMVGGSILVPGCFTLTGDNNSTSPFNGTGASATLKTWYRIISVSSSTALGILSYSVAGDAAYHSAAGTTGGAYTVSPCAKILYVSGNMLVLESNSFSWTTGDSVESPIGAYADVTAHHESLAVYTAGGVRRAWEYVTNAGFDSFDVGLSLNSLMPSGSNSTYAWGVGVQIASANAGIQVLEAQSGQAYTATATTTTTASQAPCYTFSGMTFGGATNLLGLCANGSTGVMSIYPSYNTQITIPAFAGEFGVVTSASPPANSTACFKANGTIGYLIGSTCT